MTDEQRSPEEIREEIEQTREELGDTAAAVVQKADVKKQAKAKVSGAKRKASEERRLRQADGRRKEGRGSRQGPRGDARLGRGCDPTGPTVRQGEPDGARDRWGARCGIRARKAAPPLTNRSLVVEFRLPFGKSRILP